MVSTWSRETSDHILSRHVIVRLLRIFNMAWVATTDESHRKRRLSNLMQHLHRNKQNQMNK